VKNLLLIFALMIPLIALGQNVNVYKEQGGDRMVVDSGGSLDVASGGELDVESGGALKIAGTSMTSSAAELNKMDGVTSTTAELNIMDGVTSTAAELNILDGVTSTAAELNQVDETAAASDGVLVKKLVRSTYDEAVDGGAIAAYDLGEDLPANAIVTQVWFQIITQFVDGGAGTVALSCAGADDLFAAADITGSAVGTITAGVPVGTAATMFDVGASLCNVTATVAGAEQTAGKLVLWIEYVTSE